MATVIYNCKRCKTGKRMSYPERDASYRHQAVYYRVEPGRGRIYPGAGDDTPDDDCPNCGRPMSWGYLRGHHNEAVPCDARCTDARGHQCECSCGGKNHGSSWGHGLTEKLPKAPVAVQALAF